VTARLVGIPVSVYGHRWDGWSVECTGRIKQIRFCSADQIRIRTIVKRARMRATGKFPSWKNGRMMHWESPNEPNAFCLLDFRSDVIAYREQSCEIIYLDDAGRKAAHYPDIEVLTVNGRELWEVKTEYYANRDPVSRRTEILTEALSAYGLTYRVAVAEMLSMQPRLNTMQKVLRFGRRSVSSAERIDIARELVQSGRLTWHDACSRRLGPNGREILCRLVLEGFLQIDTDLPFGFTTEFVPGKRSW
jgi:hypothetical protein